MDNRSKIHTVMWDSQAGCVGLDVKTSVDMVWRLCDLVEKEHADITVKELFDEDVATAKSEISGSFRRSFVKVAVEVERKAALKGLMTDIPALLIVIPWYYLLFTESGQHLLPRTPPAWLTSKWMIGGVILACLLGIGDIWDKVANIRNGPRRMQELEKLLL